jgi:signal transduction histidine kinase
MEAVTTAAILVFSILLLSLLLIGSILSGSLWRPFRITMEKLRNYDVKKGENFIPEKTSIHEFRILNETLLKMTERIVSDYRNMKEFTENASHELQTPLAVISSRLEQLMQSGGLSEEQAALINSCRESVSRLSKINQALLLMSKIENRQFDNSEMSNLSLMIKQKLEALAELLSFKKLSVLTEIKPDVQVKLPNALADVMLNNLFNNAIRHTEKGSEIKILLDKNKMVFLNPGTPLPFPDGEIFRRFKKGSIEQESTGLGLAIVKQVCDSYKIDVNYSFTDGNHIFEFYF